jgi:glycosyltransferase involved in cell wall biosynthesis
MAAPRRIAITLEQCWHDVPGGTATSALESIRALQVHTELELVGVSARHAEPPAPAFRPSIPVRGLPLPRAVLYETWHGLRQPAVQRATGPVDAIHVTGMAMPPKTAPMVVTVHDLAFLHDPSHFTKHGVRFFHRAIELARRDADIVVCPSQTTLEDCITHGFDPARLRLVPWGIVAEPATAEAVEHVRDAFGLTRPYVFWNGTIEPRKNLGVLVEAFRQVIASGAADVDLVLAGPEGWNDELDALGASVGERVHRTGFVSPADLAALHAGAELFCFPSVREGFGLPVLESMAQGTPIVTSRGTSTEEVMGPDGEAGVLIDPADPGALAEVLGSLLGDPERLASMGEAAATRAASFTWERTALGLAAAFDEAIASGATASATTGRTPAARRRPDPPRSGQRRVGMNLLWLVPGVVGGSEEYTTRLLGALREADPEDLEVTLYVNSLLTDAYPELAQGFRTRIGPVTGANKASRVAAENTWLGWRSRRDRIEVMHHLGGIFPAWRPSSTVLTIHDLQPLAMPEHFSSAKRNFSAFVIPRSVQAAPVIVTLTEFTKRDLQARLGVDPDRVVVVPPGFDVPVGAIAADAEPRVRAAYGLGDAPYFLFPAKTWPHKNHELLLRAFALVHEARPDALLVLTGGEAHSEPRLVALARELRISDAVRRTGRIPARDVDVLYRGAVALAFPSLYEGFGIPVLEAMSRGCPVLAARATALPEVVGDAGLLLPPDDPERWSEAMVRVLEDDELRDRLIGAGQRRAREYDWEASAEVLADVYRRMPHDGSGDSR